MCHPFQELKLYLKVWGMPTSHAESSWGHYFYVKMLFAECKKSNCCGKASAWNSRGGLPSQTGRVSPHEYHRGPTTGHVQIYLGNWVGSLNNPAIGGPLRSLCMAISHIIGYTLLLLLSTFFFKHKITLVFEIAYGRYLYLSKMPRGAWCDTFERAVGIW